MNHSFFTKYKHILISIFISFIPIILSQFILCPAYETLDDAAMQLISSGAISGTPSPYLFSTSNHIGSLLTYLYNHSSLLNWYYVLIAIYYYIFTASIIYYVITRQFHNTRIIISILIIVKTYFLLKPQFTVISIFITYSAFLYLNSYLKSSKKLTFVYGISLLILSVLIRFEALVIFMILYGAILVVGGLKKRKYFSITILVTIITLLFINDYIEKKAINKACGFEFVEFVKATETIIDNPAYYTNNALKLVGWNDNALVLMREFFFIDPIVFSYVNTDLFAKNVSAIRSCHDILDALWNAIYLTLPLVTFLFVIIFINRNNIIKHKQTCIMLFSTILIMGILLLMYRLSMRVFVPLIYINIVHILIFHIHTYNKPWVKLFLIFFCCIILYQTIQISFSNESKKKLYSQTINYFRENSQYNYQLTSTSVSFEHLAGFKNTLVPPGNLLYFGWLIGHESYFKNLHKFNVQNHAEAIFTRKDIRLVCDNDFLVYNLESFACQYYNLEIKYKIVTQNPVKIYSLE